MKLYIKHITAHLAISFTFLFLISLTLSLFNIIPLFWKGKTIYLFYISLILIFFHFLFKIQSIPESDRDKKRFIKFISYMFLLSLIVLVINQFLKRQFILDYQIPIITFSIALGILTFYSNREKVETELENEKKAEDAQEARRKREFPLRFPTINRIPLVGSFVKWMYKEGRGYSLGLIAIVIVGFVLRAWNTWDIPLQADEIFHMATIKTGNLIPSLAKEVSFNSIYLRGLIIHYLGILISFFTNKIEVGLRLASSMIGALIGIIIYKIIKLDYPKHLAIVASFLITFDLWFIEFSRYIRFYIYTLMIILVLALNIYKVPFLQKKIFKTKYLFLILFGAISPYFFNEYLFFSYLILLISIIIIEKKSLTLNNLFKLKTIPIFIGSLIYILSNYTINKNLFPQLTDRTNKYILIQLEFLFNNYTILAIFFVSITLTYIFHTKLFKKDITSFFLLNGLGTVFALFIINNLTYNQSVRILLFLLIWLIPLFVMIVSFISKSLKIIILFLIVLLTVIQAINLPLNIGDSYAYEKIVYEKQPIILDFLPPVGLLNYTRDYYLASVCVNPLFAKYYFNKTPDYLIRWASPSYLIIDGNYYERTNRIRAITTVKELDEIVENSNKPILFDICGTAYPIKNEFYSSYLNREFSLEVSKELTAKIESYSCKVEFKKRDGFSKDILVCNARICELCEPIKNESA